MTTEALLASALGVGDAHELFGWRRRLSFVEEGPHGLFPYDLARRHEGDASARIAEHWWRRQPEAFAMFRGSGGELVGFIAGLALHRADPADLDGASPPSRTPRHGIRP